MEKGIGGDLAAGEVFRLRQSIEEFNKQASKQTQQMLRLTRVIAVLTAIMTVAVVVQIYLATR
jgi:predicted lysophospholipase L1 biosynthesis ABC-type transport system permease subunit